MFYFETTVGSQMMRQVCFVYYTSIIHRVCPFGLECWNSLFLLQYRKVMVDICFKFLSPHVAASLFLFEGASQRGIPKP